MNVKHYPHRIEDFTANELSEIKDYLIHLSEVFSLDVLNIFIVGSTLFGLPAARDLDIVLETRRTNDLDRDSRLLIRRYLYKLSSAPIDLMFIQDWQAISKSTDLGFLIPYYDLRTNILHNKEEGSVLNFTFHYDSSANHWVTTTRDRTRNIIDILKNSRYV